VSRYASRGESRSGWLSAGRAEKEAAAVEKELIEKGRARIDIKFDFNKAVVKPQYHMNYRSSPMS